MQKFRILFEELSGFSQGDVVGADSLSPSGQTEAAVAYLTGIGAIELVAEEPKVAKKPEKTVNVPVTQDDEEE